MWCTGLHVGEHIMYTDTVLHTIKVHCWLLIHFANLIDVSQFGVIQRSALSESGPSDTA